MKRLKAVNQPELQANEGYDDHFGFLFRELVCEIEELLKFPPAAGKVRKM